MAPSGAFTFVLHSHLPYARQAGRWPHGEEWLHEAAAETYIPLLDALYKLREDRVAAKMTLTLTPILVEQLADADVQVNFKTYLEDRIKAAEKDVERFSAFGGEQELSLANFYLEWYRHTLHQFVNTYSGNLVPAFKRLQDDGLIEIVTCAATHGYLPLLQRDESINLQLRTAVESYHRHFGRYPRAIWLPECAYRPAYVTDDGRVRPGLEHWLALHNLSLFFAETHMIEGGRPVGVAAGEAIGPYGAVVRRYLVPFTDVQPVQQATTFQPYFVSGTDVAVIGRNNKTGLQVWSADWGYPGDFDYREFHKKDGVSGLQYWRVTGAGVDLGGKELYHPEWAAGKVRGHAEHFSHLVEEELEHYRQEHSSPGIISANYDTELFGHWWFEGVSWLEAVLRQLAASDNVELVTGSGYIEKHPPEIALNLPEGSWGAGGTHFVWDNADTHWMWPVIFAAEDRMLEAVSQHQNASGIQEQILNQAARELLLLQSSDWPFLVTTGQAREYAIDRFRGHVDRFNLLLDSLSSPGTGTMDVDAIWEKDKIFPEIDFRWFQA
ncbi:MAG: glycoside hydrolase family 57 protein [Anaerolineales bacterium]